LSAELVLTVVLTLHLPATTIPAGENAPTVKMPASSWRPYAASGARQLSSQARDAFRQIIGQMTFAETTKALCDEKFQEFNVGKYTNLRVWKESQRLFGAKAFLSQELDRLDPELKKTIDHDIIAARTWLDKRSAVDKKMLCENFLSNYRDFFPDSYVDQNLLWKYAAFYSEAERLFPRYFTRVGSDRWERTDPTYYKYAPLPEGMSWWFGEIVEDDRVIYAEKPETADTGTGYSLVVGEFIVLSANTAKGQGPMIKVKRSNWHDEPDEWYAIEPPRDGFTFEGEFTTYDTLGFATTFGFAGRASDKVFKFTKDGHFRMASDSSDFSLNSGGDAARISKAHAAGQYYVSGYAIELQLEEGGEVARLPFVPYNAAIFGANSKDGSRIAYLNLDGKLYLRSDGGVKLRP
jgi:hypothetical protein